MNGNFLKLNVNPKNRKTTDCVIRAIVSATGKDWCEVFDALCSIARKKAYMPNGKHVYEEYLKQCGFVKVNVSPASGKLRWNVWNLAREVCADGVVFVANHAVAINGKGNYIDTWDSGEKKVYALWLKSDFPRRRLVEIENINK